MYLDKILNMKYHHNMKIYFYIFLVFIIFFKQSYANTVKTNVNYKLKLNILGIHIKIGEINSYMEITDDNYNLNFILASENLVNAITSIKGRGNVNGKIKDLTLYPKAYQYKYTKKKKEKKTQILFNNSFVTSSSTIPKFDKNNLTPIVDSMLIDVIDPVTAIIYLGDYTLNKKCTNNYRIFDGKRRYNLNYTNKFKKDDYIVCRLTQEKIGGFKLSDDENDIFKPAQEIDTYFIKANDAYILKKIITKNNFSNLLIEVDYF